MAPDRGLDVIHHYRIDQELGWLKDCPHIQLKANVSPRRAKYFKTSKGVAMLYVGTEKTNKIVAYPITNPDQNPNEGCLKWGEPTVIDAFGNGTAKNKPFLGEMRIKHDMLYVSDRNDNSFGAGNDSMSIFSINQDTGIPKFVRRFSVGSQAPKTFSFNAKGDKMVIGAQQSGRFVINSVNTTTGMPGAVANQSVVAPTNGMVGGLTSVLFAE